MLGFGLVEEYEAVVNVQSLSDKYDGVEGGN
jgi:hypothetical protein